MIYAKLGSQIFRVVSIYRVNVFKWLAIDKGRCLAVIKTPIHLLCFNVYTCPSFIILCSIYHVQFRFSIIFNYNLNDI